MRKCMVLMMLASLIAVTFITPAPASEMRGLWVDAWNPGFKSADETTAMVAKAKECNFNALFVQVRKRGDAYYKSTIEPMAKDIAPEYDPLADVVTKAHAAGLQVHAWIIVFEVYHNVPEVKADPGQVHIKHPEWLMKDQRGNAEFPGNKVFLDPGVPEARDYLVGIVKEIASKYKVDGVHLDMARYPSREGGYNQESVARFNEKHGRSDSPDSDNPEWADWRRAQVNEFVKRAHETLHKIKPTAQLSAAVFANRKDAFWHRFQDWEQWLKDGTLDFATPMLFVIENRVFEATLTDNLTLDKHKPVYVGQAGYKNGAANSIEQINLIRKAGGRGMILYNYWFCAKPRPGDTKSIMDTLKEGLFAKPDSAPTLPATK